MRKDIKTVLVSHIDLDGYGCNIMAMRYLGMDIPIVNVNYDELADKLVEIPRTFQVIITDLSIPENLKGLLEEFEHVVVIDHHKSTQWATEWGMDNDKVEVFVSEERCATWWFYEYLAKQYSYRDDLLDEWAKYIDDYDRYVLQYPESRRLNALLYISNKDRFVTDALRYSPKVVLNNNKERIDRYFEQQDEYIGKTSIFMIHYNPNVAILFAEKNKSAIAERLIKDRNIDLVYGVDLHNMTVSLRSSPISKIDCSKIAKMIHPEGGGHLNASGASLEYLMKDWLVPAEQGNIFKMILNLPVVNLPTYTEDD